MVVMENEKCKITFLPEGTSAYVARGTILADAACAAGVRIGRHCGGAGVCGKCRVTAREGDDPLSPPSQTELNALGEEEVKKGVRLSCCSRVVRDGSVTVIDHVEHEGNRILESFPENIEEWSPDAAGCGISIDIGTTTVVCYLFNLDTHSMIDRLSFLNPQVTFGDDVISRIAYSSSSTEALENIQRTLTSEMDSRIGILAERNGIKKEDITEIVIAGNTVMEHLFAGVSPKSIGRSPYTPEFLTCPPFQASRVGLNVKPGALVKLLPNVAGYVGADIVAGVAALSMEHSPSVKLLVDIGTNNEIVIGSKEGLCCCATAAGPALEGARIQYGMRASTGAIEKVFMEDGGISYKTIGGVAPSGICGSGIIDAIALALRERVIDKSGRFQSPETCSDGRFRGRLGRDAKGMVRLLLTDEENPVYLTQKDVREVQLAVGAVRVGTEVMLEHAGISADGLSEVFLAGAFGNNINIESAITVGLIPDVERSKIRSVKNSSGLGASMALASAAFYESTKETAKKMKYVELSSLPDFQKRFVAAMSFLEIEG